jgi:hypothetical protein
MAKQNIGIGSTGHSEYIYIIDSLSSTGLGKTGISYNTSGLNAHYVRSAGSATTITLASQTATGAWISGGWAEVDGTRMPGLYRVDLPDAIFASGSDKSIVFIKGVSNSIPVTLEYQLTAINPNTFTEASIANSTWTNGSRTITGGTVDNLTQPADITTASITNIWTDDPTVYPSPSAGYYLTNAGSSTGITAGDVWTNPQRTITGGIADTITTLTNRSGFAITSNSDKNGYTITAGIITSITNPVEISTNSMSGIANTVWTNTTRTLSATGISAYDIWNYANRTLTAASGATAYEIWTYNNRTLSATGISAYDIWNYTDRTITGGTGISLAQPFPENFEFMLITNTGRIYLNKADIQKIKT